eukprot:9181776-Alexandrium_andersonii.AAC.1
MRARQPVLRPTAQGDARAARVVDQVHPAGPPQLADRPRQLPAAGGLDARVQPQLALQPFGLWDRGSRAHAGRRRERRRLGPRLDVQEGRLDRLAPLRREGPDLPLGDGVPELRAEGAVLPELPAAPQQGLGGPRRGAAHGRVDQERLHLQLLRDHQDVRHLLPAGVLRQRGGHHRGPLWRAQPRGPVGAGQRHSLRSQAPRRTGVGPKARTDLHDRPRGPWLRRARWPRGGTALSQLLRELPVLLPVQARGVYPAL